MKFDIRRRVSCQCIFDLANNTAGWPRGETESRRRTGKAKTTPLIISLPRLRLTSPFENTGAAAPTQIAARPCSGEGLYAPREPSGPSCRAAAHLLASFFFCSLSFFSSILKVTATREGRGAPRHLARHRAAPLGRVGRCVPFVHARGFPRAQNNAGIPARLLMPGAARALPS